MRKMIFILSILSIVLFFYPVNAQDTQAGHHPGAKMQGDSVKMMKSGSGMMQGQGMMQGKGMMGMMEKMHDKGMMCQGMSALLSKSMPVIKRLPTLKEELGLSDQQTKQLKKLQDNFQKFSIDQKAQIEKAQIDLKALVESNASSAEIRKVLEKISKSSIDKQVEAYNTANAMLKLLKPDQKEKWQNLQTKHKKDCPNMKKKDMKKGMHQK